MGSIRRNRHLLFLAHLWACVPFVLVWLFVPYPGKETRPSVLEPMAVVCAVAAVYLAIRTWLAWRRPDWSASPWFAWD